ncbi:MAG TPA: serine/threonine-protein kinase [Mycobacterium sp.]|nr:serine/threonine-protein kinase [Mycobacterium sp.]
MPLINGATFAGFRIIRLIAVGGMGEVYLVQHPRLPRQEALKILPADMSTDPEFRQRFSRESDLAATMWHPHIVGLHDRGESDGRLWLSMDFVDGADAGLLLHDHYPTGMPAADVIEIISAIAEALDYAHDRGLCHRDVKPGNIVLTSPTFGTRRVLLTDFGIARRLDDARGLTQTNVAVGTVDYAAPEQLTGGPLDGRADQYSLAMTAFQLLTGVSPFRDSNPAVVISRHLNDPPPRLSSFRPELAGLDAALSGALTKDPADRFRRCQDFANALWVCHTQPPGPTAAAAAAVPIGQPAPTATPGQLDTGTQTRQAPVPSAPPEARPGVLAAAEARPAPAAPPRPPSPGTGAEPPASSSAKAATDHRKPRRRRRLRNAMVVVLTVLAVPIAAIIALMLLSRGGQQVPAPPVAPSPATATPDTPVPPATTTPVPPAAPPPAPAPPKTPAPAAPQAPEPAPPRTTTPSSPQTTTPSSPQTTAPSSPATTTPPSSAETAPPPAVTITRQPTITRLPRLTLP